MFKIFNSFSLNQLKKYPISEIIFFIINFQPIIFIPFHILYHLWPQNARPFCPPYSSYPHLLRSPPKPHTPFHVPLRLPNATQSSHSPILHLLLFYRFRGFLVPFRNCLIRSNRINLVFFICGATSSCARELGIKWGGFCS